MLSLSNKLTINTRPIYRFVNKYSIDFDGVDDVIVTDGADTVLQNTTYAFWSKSSQTGGNTGVFGHGAANIGAFHFNFSSGKPLLYLGSGSFINWNISGDQQDDGEWHHWVVYSDTNNIANSKLYVDGVLQIVDGATSTPPYNAYTESLSIGGDKASGGNYFEGKIDEFAVYDRELKQDEITRMYNTYYSPNRVANGNFATIGNEEVTNGDFSQEGSEEVVNGNFSNGSTDWTLQNGWSLGNNDVEFNGTVSAYRKLFQENIITIGKQYKLTFEIKSISSGSIANFGYSGSFDTIGVKTQYFTAIYDDLFLEPTNDAVLTIDNVSVKEVGQDWSFGTGWGMGDGKALNTGGANFSDLTQNNTNIIIGKNYEITYTVSDYVSGSFKFIMNNNSASGLERNADGTYTDYISALSQGYSFRTQGSGFVGSIDNVSVKEVGQNWIFDTGWSTDGTKALFTAGGSQYAQLEQIQGLNSNATYKVLFDLVDTDSLGVYVRLTSGSWSSLISGTGSKELSLVAGGGSEIEIEIGGGYATKSLTIDNIVVQELKSDATNLMLNAGAYQSANPLITSTKSMDFDGTDDYLQVGDVDDLDFGTESFSVCAWAKLDGALADADDRYGIIAKTDNAGGTPNGWQLVIRGSGTYNGLLARVGDGSNSTQLVASTDLSSQWTSGNWHFVNLVVNRENQTAYIYFDGAEVGSGSISSVGTQTNTNNVEIGRWAGADYFEGLITEVGTWDRTLTSLEVASLYNQGMPTNLLVNRNNYQSGNPTVFNTKQVDFDGVDDNLVFNTPSAFSGLGLNSFDCTLSVWAKFHTIGQYEALVCLGTFDLEIAPLSATDVGIWVDNAGLSTTYTPTMGEWNHYVATKSGNTYSLYVDGVLIGSDTDSDNATIGTESFIANNGATANFDGDISQAGMWNSTLTADEVSSLYNHGLPIDLSTDQAAYESSSNLVGYWRMGSGTLDSYPLIADQTDATLGSELVTNGNFATAADWTLGNGWTITGGTLNAGGSTDFSFSTTGTVVVGKTYQVKYSITSYTTGVNYLTFGGSYLVYSESAVGDYTYIITATSTQKIGFYDSGAGAAYSIDNVSVKEFGGNPAIMTNQTSSDIENGSPYANVIQNGTFDTDSDWTKGTGWTISEGKGVATSVGSGQSLSQGSSIISGVSYKVTYTVLEFSEGGVYVRVGSSGTGTTRTANGTYTETIEAAGNSTIYFTAYSGSTTLKIDNVTISELNTGLQGYWKMGDGTNDEYPVIYDQVDPTLGAEEVTNGDFATNLDSWSTSSWWVWNALGAYHPTTSSHKPLYQQCCVIGETYLITFDLNVIQGGAKVSLGTSSGFTSQIFATGLGTGSYRYYIIAQEEYIIFNRSNSGGNNEYYLNNVSVKEVQGNPATMTNMVEGNITNQFPLTKIRNYWRMGDGILDGYPIIQDQTSPNLAHIPTTNLITYSEDFSNAAWTKSASTISSNAITSPDGTQNADNLLDIATTDFHGLYQSHDLDADDIVTTSIFVKYNNKQYMSFLTNNNGASDRYAYFDLINKTIHTLSSGITASIETYANDWLRLSVTSTTAGNNAYYWWNIALTNSTTSYAGDGTGSIYIWGSQLEVQSQATAYLKSDGIAAVRKSSTTNLVPYSEDFSSYDQIQNITLTPNATTSPIGTSNATKVLSTDNSSKVRDNVSVVSGTTYTFSVYCKNIDATLIGLLAYDGVTTFQSDVTSQVSTTEWTRVSVTFTSGNTGTGQIQFARDLPNTQSAFFWGVQFEEQTQAETYAKTTGLPVTIDLFTENNYGTMTNMVAGDIVLDTPNNPA